jgi:hypothetical protein
MNMRYSGYRTEHKRNIDRGWEVPTTLATLEDLARKHVKHEQPEHDNTLSPGIVLSSVATQKLHSGEKNMVVKGANGRAYHISTIERGKYHGRHHRDGYDRQLAGHTNGHLEDAQDNRRYNGYRGRGGSRHRGRGRGRGRGTYYPDAGRWRNEDEPQSTQPNAWNTPPKGTANMAAQRWAIATDEDGYNAPVVKRVAFASTASQLKCPLCPESTDHGPFQCPYLDACLQMKDRKKLAKAFVTFNISSLPKFHTALAATGPLGPYDVLLDSQSNTNAFHSRDLLSNLQQCEPFDLGGIADGPRIVTSTNGRCVGVDFGSIYFFPDATANALSLSAVSRLYRVHYEQERNRFTIVVPGYPEDAFAFKEAHGGLHVCDFSFLLDIEDFFFKQTIIKSY